MFWLTPWRKFPSRPMVGSRALYAFKITSDRDQPVMLQGCWHRPLGISRGNQKPVLVVAHAWPAAGGTMDQSVIHWLCEVGNYASVVSLRYSYRGCGASTGQRRDALTDRNDMLEVLKEVDKFYPQGYMLLGYSYGAVIVGSLLNEVPKEKVSGVCLVSYPIRVLSRLTPHHETFLSAFSLPSVKSFPKLYLYGDRDPFSGPLPMMASTPPMNELGGNRVTSTCKETFDDHNFSPHALPGCSHYFTKDNEQLQLGNMVGPWIANICGTRFSLSTEMLGQRV